MKAKYFSLVILLSFITSGAGYVGDLPNIQKNFIDERSELEPELVPVKTEEILPLAPREIPTLYKHSRKNKNKLNTYHKQLEDILPLLSKLKVSIENENDIQMFNANTNILDLYVMSIEKKYSNKPENHYETFKKLVIVNNQARIISNYRTEALKKVKFISHYKSSNSYSDENIENQLENLKQNVEDLIKLIKEYGD